MLLKVLFSTHSKDSKIFVFPPKHTVPVHTIRVPYTIQLLYCAANYPETWRISKIGHIQPSACNLQQITQWVLTSCTKIVLDRNFHIIWKGIKLHRCGKLLSL